MSAVVCGENDGVRAAADARGRFDPLSDSRTGSLARAGLADSARRVLERARSGARAVDPERELVGNEAVVRVMLGDRADAVKLIKKYLSVHPDHRRGFSSGTGWWW